MGFAFSFVEGERPQGLGGCGVGGALGSRELYRWVPD